jgi:radical SAM superfamily enzyme YgiQ (UPF0313 family)
MSLKVLLVCPEFPVTYWGFQNTLELMGKKAMHSPLSLVTVAALCPQEWQFKLVDMNVGPLTDQHIQWADLVFVTGMAVLQRASLFQVLERCRRLKRRTVLGGPFASENTDVCAGQADVLVVGEAEVALPPFLHDLERGALRPIYQADRRPGLDTSPVPRYDLLRLGAYGVIDVQFSRGCPFNCEFCDIIELFGRLPRTKRPSQIVAEFEALRKLKYRGPVFLVDDNFIGNKKNVRLLLKELIPWQKEHGYPFALSTEATVNLADDPPLLADMREAGFTRVFVGIETPSAETLRETQKYQNTKRDLVACVHRIMGAGLEVTAGFIVGFDNDREDVFDRQVEFIRRAAIPWAMVGTLEAIRGTQLWRRLESEGRLLGHISGDQFGRPNFQTRMPPDVLFRGYLRLLEAIYQPGAYYARVLDMIDRNDEARPSFRREDGNYLDWKPIRFLRLLWSLGARAYYRGAFWRFLWQVLRRHPRRLVQAVDKAAVGHHLILYTRAVLRGKRQGAPVAIPAAQGDSAREPALAAEQANGRGRRSRSPAHADGGRPR